MLLNYFKTAWRTILRNKVYSILNIAGLATGMAVALLIGLWIYRQSSFDRFFPGYQYAYQLRYNYSDNGVIRNTTEVSLPLEAAIRKDIPGVAYVSPGFGTSEVAVRVGKDKHIQLRGMIGGAEFLQVFPFPLLKGNAALALRESDDIVLTESAARALFGETEPIGKTVRIVDGSVFMVTAVMRDLPRNSSFQLDMITPFDPLTSDGWVRAATTNWAHNFFQMYVSLRPDADPAQVSARLSTIIQNNAPEIYKMAHQQVMIQPIKDWHFYTDFKDGVAVGGLIDYIRLFGVIGILVLFIACINFMNLSTARSEKRAKEVGVRKVIGSSRNGLILQFLLESVILTTIAAGLCLFLVQLALPAFNGIAQTTMKMPWSSPGFWLVMIGYVLITGLLAGSRPAFYLSSFQPVKVLKGKLNIGRAAVLPRKVLVVVQFTCSIALIIGTVIVYQQIQHARERSKGYDPNRLIETSQPDGQFVAFGREGRYRTIKNDILRSGVVVSMTKSLSPSTEVYSHNTIDGWPGKLPDEPLSVAMNSVADADYFRTLGIPFVAGSNFADNFAVDSTCVILNEAAVHRMRLRQPINQIITWSVSNAPHRLRIIGVVRDVLTTNPFARPEPTIFVYQPGWSWTVTCRLAPNIGTQAALERLKTIYQQYNPEQPFDYHFVDERLAGTFALELLIGKMAGVFAALAIFISCLGLFGLAAYVAEQRTREIGIRKVLGASIAQVWLMLSGDFIVLVFISCLIASPVAWYFSHNWLQGYYYRVSIRPWVFILAAAVAILITLLTVSFQAVKAALMPPTKSLRGE